MPTDIQIASNALLLIGDNPINAFTEEGAGPEAVKDLYSETYRSVLAEHPWSFAFKEHQLSLLSATPDEETGFSYAFQIPPDLVRLWAVFPYTDYVIVGPYIYANVNELLARYIYEVAETSLPPHVTKCVEYKLAAELSLVVTESASRAEFYEKKYAMQLAKARTIDSQGRPQRSIIDKPFTDTRLNGFRYGFL